MMIAFSSLVRTFGEKWTIHSPLAHLKKKKFKQAECSLTSCTWAHFPDRFSHHAWTAKSTHSYFVGARVCVCLGVTCQLHLKWAGSFMYYCNIMGWNRHQISQQGTLTLEKKILLPLLLGLEFINFQSWVWHSTHKPSRLPIIITIMHKFTLIHVMGRKNQQRNSNLPRQKQSVFCGLVRGWCQKQTNSSGCLHKEIHWFKSTKKIIASKAQTVDNVERHLQVAPHTQE